MQESIQALFRVLTLLSAILSVAYAQNVDASATPAPEDAKTPYTVCTIPLEPMAYCDLNSNASSSFSGLSIQVFRDIADDVLNWKEGVDYQFVCVTTDTPTTLYERVVPEDGDCDAFIASTTITAERTENGVVWAHPYFDGSIGVIVRSDPKSSSGWAWTRPFTWELWLALGVTIVFLPLIIYYLEVLSITRQVTAKDSVKGYGEASWRTMWVMIQGETMGVTNLAARVVVIVLSFASLIISSSYTANLAAFLTIKSYGEINSIKDLVGMSVSTVEVYQDQFLRRYGLRTMEANISSFDDIKREMADVAAGTITGFLIDREVAQYYVAQWPGCQLRLLPQITEPFNYGLAFGASMPRDIVDAFSLSIMQNQEDGTIQEWGDTYLMSSSACLQDSDTSQDIAQLSFTQVYGLWVMIGGAIGVGMLLMGGKRLHVLISRFAPSLAAQTHPPCRLLVSLVRFSGTSGAGIATGDEINLYTNWSQPSRIPAESLCAETVGRQSTAICTQLRAISTHGALAGLSVFVYLHVHYIRQHVNNHSTPLLAALPPIRSARASGRSLYSKPGY